MSLFDPTIGATIRADIATLINTAGGNSSEVIIRWTETVNPVDYDPLDEDTHTGTTTEHEETVRALVHAVQIESSAYQRFTEIHSGDVIIDFPYDTDLSGRDNITFIIAGNPYTQKNVGKELAEAWDVQAGGLATTKTILATKKL